MLRPRQLSRDSVKPHLTNKIKHEILEGIKDREISTNSLYSLILKIVGSVLLLKEARKYLLSAETRTNIPTEVGGKSGFNIAPGLSSATTNSQVNMKLLSHFILINSNSNQAHFDHRHWILVSAHINYCISEAYIK